MSPTTYTESDDYMGFDGRIHQLDVFDTFCGEKILPCVLALGSTWAAQVEVSEHRLASAESAARLSARSFSYVVCPNEAARQVEHLYRGGPVGE